jgi:type IV pilus assembly protein PilC
MAVFHYKAIRNTGETFEGEVEADERFAVYAEVRKNSGTVLSIEEVGKGAHIDVSRFFSFAGSVHTSDKIMFARNLGVMLNAGLSLSRALSVLERQTGSKKFQEVIRGVSEDIRKGTNLHEAMEKFPKVFSRLYVAMVKAGNESGKLSESLSVVADQTERSYLLTKKIRGAMIYPAVIVTVMVAIGVAMLVFVIPTLVETFEGFDVELPFTTRAVIFVSNFFLHNTLLVLLFVSVAVTGVIFGLRTRQGKRIFESTILHIPVIGVIVREVNAARTARTLASLLSSGVEIVAAFGITREVIQNSFFIAVLKEAEETIERGKQMSGVFAAHEDLYPPFVGELVAVGEETGQLSAMFQEIAHYYENEVDQRTKNISTIIEPVLMVIIGIAVGFFALSIIAPIYSLSSAI